MSDPNQPQRFCRQCGTEIRAGSSFCISCGAALSSSSERPSRESQESSQDYGASQSSPRSIPPFISWYGKEESHQAGRSDFGNVRERLKGKLQYFLARFREQPVYIKVIVVLVAVVGPLIILSPLTFIAGVLLIGVSLIALLINLTKRRAWKHWGATIAVAIVPVLMFGGLSDAIYGTSFIGGDGELDLQEENSNPDSDLDESLPELSSVEEDYLDQRADISAQATEAANDQLELYNACPGGGGIYYCVPLAEDFLQNEQEVYDLQQEAQALTIPDDYYESHEELLTRLEYLYEQVQSIARFEITGSELDYMVEQANDYQDASLQALPPSAREYITTTGEQVGNPHPSILQGA